jgi:hypothetical protein
MGISFDYAQDNVAGAKVRSQRLISPIFTLFRPVSPHLNGLSPDQIPDQELLPELHKQTF